MTLRELERLIRRIEEILERPAAGGSLAKLAAEHHAIARAAVTRLNQCAEMLSAGDEHQALQLAESHPPLLEVITMLSFRRSPNWRALCRSENLPIHEPFDLKALRQLNDTYAKGIDQDHALYRDYRRAIMQHDDARALSILRSIARLNPNDHNAGGELERFEKKQRAEKARQLEALVRANNPTDAEQISQLAEEFESDRDQPAWEKAQAIRARVLLANAGDAREAGNLREASQLLQKARALSFLLDPDQRADVQALELWTQQEQQRRKEEAGRRAVVDHLAALTQRFEQEQFASRKRPVAELKTALDSVERAWRQVEHFRTSIAPDLSARAMRLRDSLRAEIENSLRASRRLALVAVAAISLVCLGAAWWAYSRQAAKSLAGRLEASVVDRRIAETLSSLETSSNYFATPALAQARARALEFLDRERSLRDAADREIQTAEAAAARGFTNAAPAQIAATFLAAQKAIAALAPESRGPASAALAKTETAWKNFVERERASRGEQLAILLAPLEAEAKSRLPFTRPPQEVMDSAAALDAQLAPARRLVESEILRPKQETLFRLQTLDADIKKSARDATNWFAAQTTLASATNWDAYNRGLQMLVSSGFTPAAQRAAAAAIAGLNLNSHTLLAPLLLTNGPASALLAARAERMPDEILPAEREIQRSLRDDQSIHGILRLDIEVKALPPEDPRRKRTVYLRGELQRRITRRSGQIYDPVENPSALAFAQKEMASLDFTVDEPATTAEKDLYERAGLARLLDSNTGKYRVSLLQVLDDINFDRRASPLFRAYLFGRVCEMIDAQPIQWGAIWSPALAQDRAELSRLGISQIHSGDWLIPANIAARAASLAAHFDKAALHSYSREAAFFKKLLPQAVEIGVRPVGFVSAEGEPQITDLRFNGPVWGLPAPGSPAVVVWENGRRKGSAYPFSPLFIFGGDAAHLINTTLQSLSYSPSGVGLPEALPPILRANP